MEALFCGGRPKGGRATRFPMARRKKKEASSLRMKLKSCVRNFSSIQRNALLFLFVPFGELILNF